MCRLGTSPVPPPPTRPTSRALPLPCCFPLHCTPLVAVSLPHRRVAAAVGPARGLTSRDWRAPRKSWGCRVRAWRVLCTACRQVVSSSKARTALSGKVTGVAWDRLRSTVLNMDFFDKCMAEGAWLV
jgi:hypothetical protein